MTSNITAASHVRIYCIEIIPLKVLKNYFRRNTLQIPFSTHHNLTKKEVITVDTVTLNCFQTLSSSNKKVKYFTMYILKQLKLVPQKAVTLTRFDFQLNDFCTCLEPCSSHWLLENGRNGRSVSFLRCLKHHQPPSPRPISST